MTKEITANPYDEIPYKSYPYAQSSPEKLATLGTLFGMTPPKIETARVLELGCAEGDNIIPHAVNYPNSTYVGVDLSKVQIDTGLANIKSLGLKNIELKHCSIADIDESFGKFDYIICHGVFSLVDESIRQKILEISSKNLTQNGIAYISYNTLPGWNMVRTIRDMMSYHSKGFADVGEGITQSRAVLEFVKDSLEGSETPYAKMLSEEADLLTKQGDDYLKHDYLGSENKQFYFNEFIQEASKNNLQYLSDANLASMYTGNLGDKVAETLKGINDIVRTEQYMDFITNRRFRNTLLCHSDVKINRTLNSDNAKNFALSLDVIAEKELSDIDIESNESLKFFFRGDKEHHLGISSPSLKAIFYTLIENRGYPISFKTILKEAGAKLKTTNAKQLEAELLHNAMNLIIKGYVEISLHERRREKVKLDKPSISAWVSSQASNPESTWITNNIHEPVAVNFFDKQVLKYINGKNSKQQILSHLIKEVESGHLGLNQGDKQVEDVELVKKELSAHLDYTISKFSMQAVLK